MRWQEKHELCVFESHLFHVVQHWLWPCIHVAAEILCSFSVSQSSQSPAEKDSVFGLFCNKAKCASCIATKIELKHQTMPLNSTHTHTNTGTCLWPCLSKVIISTLVMVWFDVYHFQIRTNLSFNAWVRLHFPKSLCPICNSNLVTVLVKWILPC